MEPDVTGIVLAGGGVTRFGDDKLKAELRGKSLLHHPIEALSQVCSRVVVVTAHGASAPTLPEVDAELVVVHDRTPGHGGVLGLASALDMVWTPYALVAGSDMPDMAVGVLEELLVRARARDEVHAVVLETGDSFSPLPCVVRSIDVRQSANAFLLEGGIRLKELLTTVPSARVQEDEWHRLDPTGTTVHDVDRADPFPPG